jgi:hypothetical protein
MAKETPLILRVSQQSVARLMSKVAWVPIGGHVLQLLLAIAFGVISKRPCLKLLCLLTLAPLVSPLSRLGPSLVL